MTVPDDPWRQARAAWPQLPDDPAGFARHVERLGTAAGDLHAADVYLALHCAAGVPAAVDAFLAGPFRAARATLHKVRCPAELIEELEQELRVLMVVGHPPQLAGYAGRGPLASWVASIAARRARKRLAGDDRRVSDEDALADLAAADDPELAYLQHAYRDACAVAVTDALAGLTVRERNLLRQHHLDGLTLEELAALYGAHRATVARWLAAARAQVVTDARALLAGRCAIDPDELDSIVRLIRSQVQVSLRRLLGA